MSIWKKLFSDDRADEVDYYQEGLELLRVGHYHDALTSFRLALKAAPGDTAVLQQIAITHTRIGMTDEASRTYRQVLAQDAKAAGAHYGLAFLLLRSGRRDEAEQHLRSFLELAPAGPEAERHIEHARRTLAELEAGVIVDGEA
jgi:Flp pilus assembly protein TadD